MKQLANDQAKKELRERKQREAEEKRKKDMDDRKKRKEARELEWAKKRLERASNKGESVYCVVLVFVKCADRFFHFCSLLVKNIIGMASNI